MMDEMNVLNAPKKVVDGLTEVFEGLAQGKSCFSHMERKQGRRLQYTVSRI